MTTRRLRGFFLCFFVVREKISEETESQHCLFLNEIKQPLPQYNVGKDTYTVDLESDEKLYWLDTESGLLGAFGFEGACTVGDGSGDPPTRSMGVD